MPIDKGIVMPNERRLRATVVFDVIVPGGVGDREFLHRCFDGTRLQIVDIKAVESTSKQGGTTQ